ncbi:MAG TPA: hypothetical protein PK458_18220 [Phycisphaerae bacterium]|nr:hypothetical protein [Phycisphaerae bacterium]HON67109.1 hypothetical protein [Phycisphaerae bacterium]HPU28117.1 hypothetical protein [Phycisphaerae bacterium]
MKLTRHILTITSAVVGFHSLAAVADVAIRRIPGQAELGTVEIHHVSAGAFNPELWRAGTLNILPDVRSPMLAPRLDGVWRNIYAPSAVEVPGGWRLFYGAWDGVTSGNDRIYCVSTTDFLTFEDRRTVIEHGEFIHVCNVSAVRLPDGTFHLMCTAYPIETLNKPAAFRVRLPDASSGAQPSAFESVVATREHLATIEGYEPFAVADMNGINAILLEDGQYRLYFGDFKNWGHVHRASSTDGKHFRYDGPCLPAPLMVNDVKKFTPGGRPCYLMGLHANNDRLWYALSDDGMKFEPQRVLATSTGAADRYIVAIGLVTKGERLLGFVYGAGAVPGLDRNRLFARWLQKKLVFTDDAGQTRTATAALGPDRAVISLGDANELTGTIQVFAEDGKTPLSAPLPVKLVSGAVYELQ